MSSVLCNTTGGYGVFGFSPMALGILGAVLIIAIVATLMIAAVSGSQWAIASFLVVVVTLVLLVITWWTSPEAVNWNVNGAPTVVVSLIILAVTVALAKFVIEETY